MTNWGLSNFLIVYGHSPIKASYMHTTLDYEIFLLLNGTSNYFLNDNVYSLSPGDMILISPDDLRYNQYTSAEYERYTVNFSVDFLPEEISPILKSLFQKRIISADPDWCRKIFDEIARERKKNDNFSEIVIKNRLIYLFTELFRNGHISPDANLNRLHPVVTKIINYINIHYAEDITLEFISEMFHFNNSYISRIFHNAVGMSFKQYLMFVRIEKASKILSVDFDRTIHEIAYKCGFNDSNYFSVCFKKLKNYTPIEYRKMKMRNSKKNTILE